MKNQKEAERAEQQRIKNLVLNYDLQDSNTDQAGTDKDPCDHLSYLNPNFPKGYHGLPHGSPTQGIFTHNDSTQGSSSDKYTTSQHQHNGPLHHSIPNPANARAADKSSSNRSGHRARKLQLSDVDWYEIKDPYPSRSRGGRGSHFRSSRRTAS